MNISKPQLDLILCSGCYVCYRPLKIDSRTSNEWGLLEGESVCSHCHYNWEYSYGHSITSFTDEEGTRLIDKIVISSYNDPPAEATSKDRELKRLIKEAKVLFPPLYVDPCWLAWNDGTVQRLATAIRRGNATLLPILGDALEEAGCTDADILGHCRADVEHQYDCWVAMLLTIGTNWFYDVTHR